MKNCELCKVPARTYCESDQASLCWNCDAKVHRANFLVARHYRTLLCHSCHSQTPWKASGSKLGHTVSVCESCVRGTTSKEEAQQSEVGNDVDLRLDEDDNKVDDIVNDDDFDDESDEEEEEEEADNQVVPWSTTLPPPATSSSSSEEVSVTTPSLKRMREDGSDLPNPLVTQDDLGLCLFQRGNDAALTAQASDGDDGEDEATSLRPWKDWAVEVDGGAASSLSTKKSLRRVVGEIYVTRAKNP